MLGIRPFLTEKERKHVRTQNTIKSLTCSYLIIKLIEEFLISLKINSESVSVDTRNNLTLDGIPNAMA